MEYNACIAGFTFIFISGLSGFILFFYPFIYSSFSFLFIGKWASSILGGLVYSLPSISTSLPISYSIQPRRTFLNNYNGSQSGLSSLSSKNHH